MDLFLDPFELGTLTFFVHQHQLLVGQGLDRVCAFGFHVELLSVLLGY